MLTAMDEMLLSDWSSQETPRFMARLRRAAESWGAAQWEMVSIKAVVKSLRRRGATLRKRGRNGSYYGKMADGRGVRISDHLGRDSHDVEVVLDMPMTRVRVWQYVSEQLQGDER